MKHFFLILILAFSAAYATAQTDIDCRLAKSYANQDIKSWNKFLDELTTEYNKTKSPEILLKRVMVRHLYIAQLLFTDKDSDKAETHLDLMREDLDKLSKNEAYKKRAMAFESPYYAYGAINSPITAAYRFPKSYSAASDAIEKAKDEAYSWTEYGNLKYSMAKYMSGGFADAISAFKKSATIIENAGKNTSCNWYYIHTLLFLAKSYEDNKQFTEANKVYDKILEIRPDYEAIHRWKHK